VRGVGWGGGWGEVGRVEREREMVRGRERKGEKERERLR
jgi:hypothetical protein